MATEPSFRRLPRAVREQQMLDAAVEVFSRRGYHGASMDEIAEAAGISKPMLYAYLGAKEELFTACLRREGERLVAALVTTFSPADGTSLDRRLWQGLRAFFTFVAAHRDGWAVLYQQARGEARFAAVLGELRERVIDMVAVLLRNAAAASPGCGADPGALELLAPVLVGAAETLADRLAARPDADPDRMADQLVAVVWLGGDALLRGAVWEP
jgi:AcrR family transcriptional regulator